MAREEAKKEQVMAMMNLLRSKKNKWKETRDEKVCELNEKELAQLKELLNIHNVIYCMEEYHSLMATGFKYPNDEVRNCVMEFAILRTKSFKDLGIGLDFGFIERLFMGKKIWDATEQYLMTCKPVFDEEGMSPTIGMTAQRYLRVQSKLKETLGADYIEPGDESLKRANRIINSFRLESMMLSGGE